VWKGTRAYQRVGKLHVTGGFQTKIGRQTSHAKGEKSGGPEKGSNRPGEEHRSHEGRLVVKTEIKKLPTKTVERDRMGDGSFEELRYDGGGGGGMAGKTFGGETLTARLT